MEAGAISLDDRADAALEIGFGIGGGNQNLAGLVDDAIRGLIEPLAVAIDDGKAIGKLLRDDFGREVGPFGLGHRAASRNLSAEKHFDDRERRLARNRAGGRVLLRGATAQRAAGEDQCDTQRGQATDARLRAKAGITSLAKACKVSIEPE